MLICRVEFVNEFSALFFMFDARLDLRNRNLNVEKVIGGVLVLLFDENCITYETLYDFWV